MRRGLATPIACSALLLLAGCGSSGKSGAGATATTGATTATTGPGDASATKSTSNGGGLRPYTKPKFAAPEASAPVQSGVVQIAYRNIAIDPDTLRVKVGSTLRWTNYDSIPHNVTSEGGPQKFASKNFGEGATFEVKAERPGVIHYESTTQPVTMNGSIEVLK
jgi:plastocyanin